MFVSNKARSLGSRLLGSEGRDYGEGEEEESNISPTLVERKGGSAPIVALEVFSSRAVNSLLGLTWLMNITTVIFILMDSYLLPSHTHLFTFLWTWVIWAFLNIVTAIIFIVISSETSPKEFCSFMFLRDWSIIENASCSLMNIATMILVPAFTLLCIVYTYALSGGDGWSGWFYLAEIHTELPSLILITMLTAGFGRDRLTFLFYFPRFALVFLRYAIRILRTSLCSEITLPQLVKSNEWLDFTAGRPTCRAMSNMVYASLILYYAVVIFDLFSTKRLLAERDYMASRFRQILFRFGIFDIGVSMILYFLITLIFFLSYLATQADKNWFFHTNWPGALLMLRPLLIVSGCIVMLIAFLPPRKKSILCYELRDQDPFEVPWGDVTLALVASYDAYFDHPDSKRESVSGFGRLSWKRRAYRYIDVLQNYETDANCLIAEINPDLPEKLEGWNMNPGDLIIAFRGTGSWANVKSDLQFSREALPFDFLLPRFSHTNAKESVLPTRSRRQRTTSLPGLGGGGGGELYKAETKAMKKKKATGQQRVRYATEIESDLYTTFDLLRNKRRKDSLVLKNTKTYHSVVEAPNHANGVSDGEAPGASNDEKRGAEEEEEEGEGEGGGADAGMEGSWRQNRPANHEADSLFQWLLRERVHSGFLRLYMSLREDLFRSLDPLLAPIHQQQQQPSNPKRRQRRLRHQSGKSRQLFITGHSLGAALATIAALDLRTRYAQEYDVRMVNLASPRVGDHGFANVFNSLIPDALRVIVSRDVIPGFPKFFCLFKHVGHEVTIDKKGHILVDPSPIENAFVKRGSSSYAAHTLSSYEEGVKACLGRQLQDRGQHEKMTKFILARLGDTASGDTTQIDAKHSRNRSVLVPEEASIIQPGSMPQRVSFIGEFDDGKCGRIASERDDEVML